MNLSNHNPQRLSGDELAAIKGGAQYVTSLTKEQRESLQGTTVTDPVSETFNRLWKKATR